MGDECSRPKQRVSMKESLIDEVFSWSLDESLDQELFKDKVEKIPESFKEVEEYFGSFVYPLLEETRAELSFSLENVSRAPYAQIFEISKGYGTGLYNIKVDYWRNRVGVHGKDPYETLPGDIFVLTEAKPETISDLRWLGRGWAVKFEESSDGYDDNANVTCLQVKALKDDQVNFSLGKNLFVVFLMNVRTYERIWKSLHTNINLTVIKQILSSSTQEKEKNKLFTCLGNCIVVEESMRTFSSQLNESQRKVIVDILCKVKCNHRSSVELIWGPPGTGKTKTLSILLCILLSMRYRTLICASTDTAIKQVASLVLKLIKNSSSFSSGSILYFGNNSIAKVDADIAEIYLNHKDKSLYNCLQTASLVFCTASCSSILHSVLAEPLKLLIIDEATQLKECESLIPLQLPGVKHTVLFGDHCQLTATVISNVSARAGFGRSLFERLTSFGYPKHILNMQYRMDPLISSFPNSKFYANCILDAPNVRNRSFAKCFLPSPLFGAYSFINISFGNEEMDSLRCSFKNMVEVAIVIKIVQKLFEEWSKSTHNLSVGIMSPYTAQVVSINEKVGRRYENLEGFLLKVNTIDGFQGGEEDIVIFSTVRTNAAESIGFISDQQQTNVALTRARYSCWILGNGKTLSDSDTVWKSIVQDAKDRKCFYNADEVEDLADVVLKVKQELDQFDDVLNADSILFKNARWKVLFSDDFKKSFGKLKSSEMKKLVINLLLRLSCGWRPKRRNTNINSSNFSQMLKQFEVKDLHVICSNDILKDSMYIQILKVWDILPLEDIPKLVTRLDSVFQSYTDAFIIRCKKKYMEGDLEVPMSWCNFVARHKSHQVEIGNNSSTCHSGENGSVDSLLLMKFYSLSTSIVSHLISSCDGNEMDFPFELTDEEMEIIRFNRSSFILARSGTGKTTVLIMKLFQKEQLHHLSLEGFHELESNSSMNVILGKETDGCILRQIFVTVNARLCYSVRQYISRLKRSTCWNSSAESSKIVEEDFDEILECSDIPDSFTDLPQSSYPLVITFKKFLMMLNGTVGRSFFERFPELRGLSQEKRKASKSLVLKTFIRTKEVSYEMFCSSYWPSFSPLLTKKLDPSLVFAEIISHIKGGSRIGVNDYTLSREDYISYSMRRLSAFSQQDRGRIYGIFLEYEKKKKRNGEFDMSDLVIDLHHRLRDETYEGEKMDFVYIDEVQDWTMRQISLFKYICRNFEEGFVFSGDTAQTIVRGVDFRFEDIRALFYTEFLCERKEKGKIADVFHLSQNFRTHAGVLRLANSVVDLLYHFFPSSVDKLKPETNLVKGEHPVWVQAGDGDNALGSLIRSSGSSYQGFGAEQGILVRNEDDKNEVFNLLGKQALVLTIVECKGLEFEDVLLYNFFSSSPLNDQWDAIYGYMKEQGLLEYPHPKSFPPFNEGKHIALCSELKQLYVAITRTRQRLWIFENELCSLFNYWEKLQLVHTRKLDGEFLQEIQVVSSKEEWKARGIKFFHQENYEKAKFCFGRAGESYWEKWAAAAGHRCIADHLRDSDPIMARSHLTQAAHMFESVGKNESAAQCFFELNDYEKAGIIYLEKFGGSKGEEAGECFHLAGCYKRAADIYAKCNLFSKCLTVCVDGKLFEMGYQYIQSWKKNNCLTEQESITSTEVQSFFEKGALDFNKLKDSKTMMKFVRAFQSKNLMRTFLKDADCLDELLFLEKEWGNFAEAANVANMKGDVLLEADLLEMARLFEKASSVILVYVLYNSLWVQESKGWPLRKFVKKEELLVKAKALAKNASSGFYDFICMEANILSHDKVNLFQMERYWESSWKTGSLRGKMLCARKFLDAYLPPSMPKHMLENDLMKHEQNRKSWEETSVGNLLVYWDFWKEETEKMLEYVKGDSKDDSYSEFCMNYFGVSKQLKNGKTVYLLLYPDAAWVKDISIQHIKRNENSKWIAAGQFVLAAKTYWSSEMLTVGMKVLEILVDLYMFSVDNALSLYCASMLLTQILKVLKSLIESKFLNRRESGDLQQKFLEIPRRNYLGHVYLLDWKNSSTNDMVYLRDTELYRNLLKEIICSLMSSRTMTSEETGWLMTILLSGKFSPYLYEQIAESFGITTSWKMFIQINDTTEDPVKVVRKFQKALEAVDYADFAPSCFLYLIDRLLIMVSYLKGYFFTTKSSLVELLISKRWNTNPNLIFLPDLEPSLKDTVHFVAFTVEELLCQEQGTINWIKKYNLSTDCFPLLVLRLFVIICLLCINFGGYSDLFFNLLRKREITSLLPWEFYQSLKSFKENDKAEVKIEVVAEALKKIGNPLVIVNLGIEFSFPDAIFLNLNVEQHRGSILKKLHFKNGMGSSNQTRSRLGVKQSCGRGHHGVLPTSSFVSIVEQNAKTRNEDGLSEAQRTNRHFWMVLGSWYFEGTHRKNFQVDVPIVKEAVLGYILLINSAMRGCSESNHPENCCEELNNVLDEVQQLYSALGSSNIIQIQNTVKKLQPRRESMEPFVDQLLTFDRKEVQQTTAFEPCILTEAVSHKDGADSAVEKCSSEVEASNNTVN